MPSPRAALFARQASGERLKFRCFWGHSGAGAGPWVLSQWWEAPFVVDAVEYRTAEHWMMSEKARFFGDADLPARIVAAGTPGMAKALGREVTGFDDGDWARVRFSIVRTGNVEKFRQNPGLADWLLTTGDAILVEASPRDTIWGIGMAASHPDVEHVDAWRGENLLGFALMEVRDRLRAFPRPTLPAGFVPLPWMRFPDIHPGSIGWRMGAGESYLTEFHYWWSTLTRDERVQVELLHPATGPWAGWFEEQDE